MIERCNGGVELSYEKQVLLTSITFTSRVKQGHTGQAQS